MSSMVSKLMNEHLSTEWNDNITFEVRLGCQSLDALCIQRNAQLMQSFQVLGYKVVSTHLNCVVCKIDNVS